MKFVHNDGGRSACGYKGSVGDCFVRAVSIAVPMAYEDAYDMLNKLAAGEKPEDEYRVLLIGDSATWGFLLEPNETLAAALNQENVSLPDGRQVRFYNLGYGDVAHERFASPVSRPAI